MADFFLKEISSFRFKFQASDLSSEVSIERDVNQLQINDNKPLSQKLFVILLFFFSPKIKVRAYLMMHWI